MCVCKARDVNIQLMSCVLTCSGASDLKAGFVISKAFANTAKSVRMKFGKSWLWYTSACSLSSCAARARLDGSGEGEG